MKKAQEFSCFRAIDNKFDLSVEFNLAIDSEDIAVRQGMPDIDSVLQSGPSLEITLDKTTSSEWLVRLPFRAGATIGDEVNFAGFAFPRTLPACVTCAS